MIYGVISVVIAYLLGSIPTAYLVTRFGYRKDIRKLGGGNVGAHNVYENVGILPAIVVGIIDVGKGVASVYIALALLESSDYYYWVFAAALAAVIGHIWPVFLKLRGGNGIATSIGILFVLMTRESLIALAVAILLLVITRNTILSVNISLLLTIPIAPIFLRDPWLPYLIFSLILILILVSNFLPTMKTALAKAGSKEKLTAELLRFEQEKTPSKKGRKK
ncbi:MAG: glycerol-3-phosphate acyltransferase [Dehalococcoidales bacterium]|nr:MAG: glycerol-3-phosphate acyltransferase [Dehalococcoidales bacterium]